GARRSAPSEAAPLDVRAIANHVVQSPSSSRTAWRYAAWPPGAFAPNRASPSATQASDDQGAQVVAVSASLRAAAQSPRAAADWLSANARFPRSPTSAATV